MTTSAVQPFALRPKWAPEDWGESVVYARSAGAAKSHYFAELSDAWPDSKYVDVRCRKVSAAAPCASSRDRGAMQPEERFTRTAKYRGVPDWRLGDRVIEKLGPSAEAHKPWEGNLVDTDSSCNFVFVDDSGQRLHAHVKELRNLDAEARGAA